MCKSKSTYIIAEAGINHNGCFETAIKLIDAAHSAGANAVKFQSFIPEALASDTAPMAQYQIEKTGNNSTQLQMLRSLALNFAQQEMLFKYCNAIGIEFLSTPFDHESQKFLCCTLGLSHIKIGSGDITNGPLLLAIAKNNKNIILSTGMSDLNEIQQALNIIAFGYAQTHDTQPTNATLKAAFKSEQNQAILKKKITLLHCTTAYPCPYDNVNLRAMDTLATQFKLSVGYSDHTRGSNVAVAAVARGATVIEKHFTLDNNQSGPDHQASIEPHQLKQMIQDIRSTEACLGSAEKIAVESEIQNKAIARKHLVAACTIRKGETFTPEALTCKRTGHGLSPMYYWQLLHMQSNKNYLKDEVITL
ncbi:MAG: N-acetylneuraminate synthase [Gammaproteobacteria bacterium]|nr:N-acetylneuraminate synthase [Gammaproteobacteria bacterium]